MSIVADSYSVDKNTILPANFILNNSPTIQLLSTKDSRPTTTTTRDKLLRVYSMKSPDRALVSKLLAHVVSLSWRGWVVRDGTTKP